MDVTGSEKGVGWGRSGVISVGDMWGGRDRLRTEEELGGRVKNARTHTCTQEHAHAQKCKHTHKHASARTRARTNTQAHAHAETSIFLIREKAANFIA